MTSPVNHIESRSGPDPKVIRQSFRAAQSWSKGAWRESLLRYRRQLRGLTLAVTTLPRRPNERSNRAQALAKSMREGRLAARSVLILGLVALPVAATAFALTQPGPFWNVFLEWFGF